MGIADQTHPVQLLLKEFAQQEFLQAAGGELSDLAGYHGLPLAIGCKAGFPHCSLPGSPSNLSLGPERACGLDGVEQEVKDAVT